MAKTLLLLVISCGLKYSMAFGNGNYFPTVYPNRSDPCSIKMKFEISKSRFQYKGERCAFFYQSKCCINVNPCDFGTPFQNRGSVFHCTSNKHENQCPSGYFCRINVVFQTSVCCPSAASSACSQSIILNRGHSKLTRHNCSALDLFCPKNYWCHFGANPEMTYCCPIVNSNSVSPCLDPSFVPGHGKYRLLRWSYNDGGGCQQFVYRGLGGNRNNFLSKDDCRRHCSFDSDPCSQPLNYGSGHFQVKRWYWNANVEQCLSFFYRGMRGNQNNFISLDNCRKICQATPSPCSLPGPPVNRHCSSDTFQCPKNQWCHIGVAKETTICCFSGRLKNAFPSMGKRTVHIRSSLEGTACKMPRKVGTGKWSLTRWYFKSNAGVCKPFSYTGSGGNENNFLTITQCKLKCLKNASPCAQGRPFMGFPFRMCNGQNSCPESYWCHFGTRLTGNVCCPGASSNPCELPMNVGKGEANLERYFYDSSGRNCLPFIYKGRKGNENNFVSSQECQLACRKSESPCLLANQVLSDQAQTRRFCSSTNQHICPVNYWCHLGADPESTVCCPGVSTTSATNPCIVPLSPGTGHDNLTRFFYNVAERQCLQFVYNGRRGNQNNFLTYEQCARTCSERLCFLSIDRGACSGGEIRYGFNRQTDRCERFNYTGCGGNLNNFHSLFDCQYTCGNVNL